MPGDSSWGWGAPVPSSPVDSWWLVVSPSAPTPSRVSVSGQAEAAGTVSLCPAAAGSAPGTPRSGCSMAGAGRWAQPLPARAARGSGSRHGNPEGIRAAAAGAARAALPPGGDGGGGSSSISAPGEAPSPPGSAGSAPPAHRTKAAALSPPPPPAPSPARPGMTQRRGRGSRQPLTAAPGSPRRRRCPVINMKPGSAPRGGPRRAPGPPIAAAPPVSMAMVREWGLLPIDAAADRRGGKRSGCPPTSHHITPLHSVVGVPQSPPARWNEGFGDSKSAPGKASGFSPFPPALVSHGHKKGQLSSAWGCSHTFPLGEQNLSLHQHQNTGWALPAPCPGHGLPWARGGEWCEHSSRWGG